MIKILVMMTSIMLNYQVEDCYTIPSYNDNKTYCTTYTAKEYTEDYIINTITKNY